MFKRRKTGGTVGVVPSVSSGSTLQQASCSSSGHDSYQRFDPLSRVSHVGSDLTGDQRNFLVESFSRWVKEEAVRESILDLWPKPDLEALKPTKLDTEFVQLLPDKARGPAKIVDSTLKRVQVKTSDALGPLGALWTKLDSFRSSGEEECDLLELLGLAERAITLVGQVYVFARHNRRVSALAKFFGDANPANKMT